MSNHLRPPPATTVSYPTSDGKPMADNTKQFRWIMTLQGGLDALFQDRPDVFVAGDLFWYPVEGKPKILCAPDVLVVFGRPKGDRSAYLQWNEGGIGPQVVFEVLSPGNTRQEMTQKLLFYERYAVEEYYLYDPDTNRLTGWERSHNRLQLIPTMQGWVSPRLGIRFVLLVDDLAIYRPDGQRFATYVELDQQRQQEWERAEQERERAHLADARAQLAHQQAEQERERAEQERERADRLVAYLKAKGFDLGDINA